MNNSTKMEQCVGQSLVPHTVVTDCPETTSHILHTYNIGCIGFTSISYNTDVLIDKVNLTGNYLLHYTQAEDNLIFRNGLKYELQPSQIQISIPGQTNQYFLPANSRHISIKIPMIYLRKSCGINIQDMEWLQNHLVNTYYKSPRLDLINDSFLYGQEIHKKQKSSVKLASKEENHSIIEATIGMLFDKKTRAHFNIPNGRYLPPPQHLFEAKKIIDSSFHKNISFENIASKVGVSDRSLRNSFSQVLDKSPQQYLQSLRLEKLHQLILQKGAEETISNLMLDCGIESWGRYAQHFQNKYGYSPSELKNNVHFKNLNTKL